MAAESHGEKKRIIWPFLPSKWVKFSVFLIKLLFFLLIQVHFHFIFIFLFDLSRSELIWPGQAVRVDPVRLLYLPIFYVTCLPHAARIKKKCPVSRCKCLMHWKISMYFLLWMTLFFFLYIQLSLECMIVMETSILILR